MFTHYDALPILSRLLPRAWQRSMLGLFDIARGADTIADNSAMSLQQRRLKIADLRESLMHGHMHELPVWAMVHARDIRSGTVSPEYAMQLLDAFLADTFTTRYATIDELDRYCLLSTASLGRGFLAIAGEAQADIEASDALCIALQLLNHWRDLGPDARTHNRIYMPQEWIEEASAREIDIQQGVILTPAWRSVLLKLDTHITQKLERGSLLAPSIKSRRLRFHVRWLHGMAVAWHQSLSHQDVLIRRISPTKPMAYRTGLQALRG